MSAYSWYRRSLWNYKGNREYTRSGYEVAKARFVEEDLDVDCTDRHYMITGSNSGIGLQVALEVARKGGIIHMVCRNAESAKRARSEIITTTGNDKIHLHIVDLARPRDVVLWVERFAAQHDLLHVLVNNAGCMVHERLMDEDGVETNFAVNTLAVHIITTTLAPLLQRSEDSRVVTVSSAGMLNVKLDPHDIMHLNLEPWNGTLVYSQNKRQQVVMTLWYAQRFDKIHFSSMHPGWADTPAVRTSIPQFYETMKDSLRTPAQGADTVVWLAISKNAMKHPSGLFFQDREPVSTHLPLAWTKTTMEDEDLLMKNIHDIFTKVYERVHQLPPSAGHSPTPPTPTTTIPEGPGVCGDMEEDKSVPTLPVADEQTTTHSNSQKTEPKQEEIVRIPPPPAAPRHEEPPPTVTPTIQEEEPTVPVTEETKTHVISHSTANQHDIKSSEVKRIEGENSELVSPNVYVAAETPKVQEVVETHASAPKKPETPEPEATNEPVVQTPSPETKEQPAAEKQQEPTASEPLIAPSSSEEIQDFESNQHTSPDDSTPMPPPHDSIIVGDSKVESKKEDTSAAATPSS